MHGFGNMLRDYLDYYHITQSDFADRLGITQKHLNGIINDEEDISIELMLAISLITDIDPNLIAFCENKKHIYQDLRKNLKMKKK
jgi:plasmid maintenance system antidote protein VapI